MEVLLIIYSAFNNSSLYLHDKRNHKSVKMTMTKKDKFIIRIKEVVRKTAPDSEIYLYGSRA
jgi:hypothetical protein